MNRNHMQRLYNHLLLLPLLFGTIAASSAEESDDEKVDLSSLAHLNSSNLNPIQQQMWEHHNKNGTEIMLLPFSPNPESSSFDIETNSDTDDEDESETLSAQDDDEKTLQEEEHDALAPLTNNENEPTNTPVFRSKESALEAKNQMARLKLNHMRSNHSLPLGKQRSNEEEPRKGSFVEMQLELEYLKNNHQASLEQRQKVQDKAVDNLIPELKKIYDEAVLQKANQREIRQQTDEETSPSITPQTPQDAWTQCKNLYKEKEEVVVASKKVNESYQTAGYKNTEDFLEAIIQEVRQTTDDNYGDGFLNFLQDVKNYCKVCAMKNMKDNMSTYSPTKQHANIVATNLLLSPEMKNLAKRQNDDEKGYYHDAQETSFEFLGSFQSGSFPLFGQQLSPKEQQEETKTTTATPDDQLKDTISASPKEQAPSHNTANLDTTSLLAIESNQASPQEEKPTANQPFDEENDITKQQGDDQPDDTKQTISPQQANKSLYPALSTPSPFNNGKKDYRKQVQVITDKIMRKPRKSPPPKNTAQEKPKAKTIQPNSVQNLHPTKDMNKANPSPKSQNPPPPISNKGALIQPKAITNKIMPKPIKSPPPHKNGNKQPKVEPNQITSLQHKAANKEALLSKSQHPAPVQRKKISTVKENEYKEEEKPKIKRTRQTIPLQHTSNANKSKATLRTKSESNGKNESNSKKQKGRKKARVVHDQSPEKAKNIADSTTPRNPLAQAHRLSKNPPFDEETKSQYNIMEAEKKIHMQNTSDPDGTQTKGNSQHYTSTTETFSDDINSPQNTSKHAKGYSTLTIGLIALSLIAIIVGIPLLLYYPFASEGESTPVIPLEDEEEPPLTSPKTPKLGKPKTPPTIGKTLTQSTTPTNHRPSSAPYILLFFLLLAAITAALLRKRYQR